MASKNVGEHPPRHPGKRVSAEQAEVQYKYGSLRITRDGRVRFSARTVLGLPDLDVVAQYGAVLSDGTHVWDRANYSIVLNVPWKPSLFMLFLSKGRITSSCFHFGLAPDEMRKSVDLLRKAGCGVERWIIPGLEFTRDAFAQHPTSDDRGPKVLAVIQELLEANRDLPVAESWKRLVRERDRWKRQQGREVVSEDIPSRKRSTAPAEKAQRKSRR